MRSQSDHSPKEAPEEEGHDVVESLAHTWLLGLRESLTHEAFQDHALRQLTERGLAELAAICTASRGQWQRHPSTSSVPGGASQTAHMPPTELLAESLDRDQLVRQADWIVIPMDAKADLSSVLAVRIPRRTGARQLADLDWRRLALALSVALSVSRTRDQQGRRVERQAAMLTLASRWHQTLDTQSLLEQIAEASTRLLLAERASIFVWDRRSKTLIARPALGVESGELRIADHKGVVGHVVQTGQSMRVDRDAGQQLIDRHTDRQLGFQTRTLLCVPLRRANGDVVGAFEMINKRQGDFTAEDEEALTELAAHAANALQNSQQFERLLVSRRLLADDAAAKVQWIGASPAIQTLRATIERVASTDLSLLILGENGTGKEVVSQWIHYRSPRRDEPFVAVNCAAIAETLLESELFGHEKGAFTDAHQSRPGKFELACGGTIFLDEIGDLSPSGQAKLLRVLEEKVIVRVGGSVPIAIEARVVAATNHDLARMVQAGKFREDLFFRLHVVTLELPPLRTRGQDILLLADHFLGRFCAQAHRPVPQLTPAAQQRLLTHTWPGNVRELRNLMERLAYLSDAEVVDVADLAFVLGAAKRSGASVASELPLNLATQTFQMEYIREHIERSQGNISLAAQRMGLHRSNLYRKMHQLGMPTGDQETDD